MVKDKARTVMTDCKQVKKAIKALALLLTMPVFLSYRGLAMLGNPDSVFQSFSQVLSLIPGKLGIYFRASFYHLACPDTSQNISIGFLTLLSHQNTTIEEGVYIGPQSNIGSCHIGKNTLIGSGVHILSGKKQHRFSDIKRSIQEQGGEIHKIKIGEDCWIGNQSTILAPISDRSIIAAASLVLEKINPEMIVGGHPAKAIKPRYKDVESH